jgi:hypothetical protein
VASTIIVFHHLGLPLADGALIGVKAAGLILVSRWIFVTFAFSSGTNDSSMRSFRSLAILLLIVVCNLGFLGLGAGSLFAPRQDLAWLLWGLAVVDAYGFFRFYGWFYNANRFDLMSIPRQ